MTSVASIPLVDVDLSRRLERTEGQACRCFVDTHARHAPERGATWIEVGGTLAMFDGPDSPITQTFGLGMFAKAQPADLEQIETFYRDRGAKTHHEVSPLAGIETHQLLHDRGYRPIELTSILYCPIKFVLDRLAPTNPDIQVQLVTTESGQRTWAETSERGWIGDAPELAGGALRELCELTAQRLDGCAFLAEHHGQPVAAGYLSMHEGTALLAGASTIPTARRQGAQLSLLAARLRHAADHGCDLAMMGAQPGSASQRNAERQGFRIAYTRIKWERDPARS